MIAPITARHWVEAVTAFWLVACALALAWWNGPPPPGPRDTHWT